MDRKSSLQANSFLATHEIPCIVWYIQKNHYLDHKSLPTVQFAFASPIPFRYILIISSNIRLNENSSILLINYVSLFKKKKKRGLTRLPRSFLSPISYFESLHPFYEVIYKVHATLAHLTTAYFHIIRRSQFSNYFAVRRYRLYSLRYKQEEKPKRRNVGLQTHVREK